MDDCALNGFFAPAQRERFFRAAALRRSVRTYTADPDVAQMSALNYAAARVCLPGVRIVLGEAPAALLYRHLPFVTPITGTGRYAAVIANDQADPHAAIHAGISGEALVLEATALGVGTCWVMAFKRKSVDVPVQAGEKVLAVIALGQFENREENARKRKKLTEICTDDPSPWPLWAYNAAECVRQAPSALNRQPWRLSFSGRTLLLTQAGGTDLDMGIALLHLSLGLEQRPHEIRWETGRNIASLLSEDRI